MGSHRVSPILLVGILIFAFFGIALILRVVLPYDDIFHGEWIKYSSVDAYYHMRLVDNMAANFPHLTNFDPYFIYPGGGYIATVNFLDWLIAGTAWIFGLGHPTQHTVDVVGVFFPAIMGALTVVPVFFIGKELFNRWAGVVAAGLVAIFGGEFIGRSMLGFTDQHVGEVFFSTVAILFFIMAIKRAKQRGLSLSHLAKLRHPKRLSPEDRGVLIKPLVYSLLAGLFLGFYLITWQGGLVFVFIISVYLVIQFVIDHVRRKSTDYLGITGFIAFLLALIIFLPLSPARMLSTAMTLAIFIPLGLLAISRIMTAYKKIKPAYYPAVVAGIGVIAILIFYAINPNLLNQMLSNFTIFAPGGATAETTIEMQPFLSPEGSFALGVAWGNFGISFYLGFIALIILLVYLIKKRGQTPKEFLIFFIWSLVILIVTLAQRRFAYYYAVNVALLAGYVSVLAYYFIRFIIDDLARQKTDYMSWKILELDNFGELFRKAQPPQKHWEPKKAKHKQRKERHFRLTTLHVSIGVWLVLAVFLLALFPNLGMLGSALAQGEAYGAGFGEVWWRTTTIGSAVETTSTARYAPTDAWQSSLIWLRENTPEPLGDPDAYYQMYERPTPGTAFTYPESAYGVTSWWDFGYWISRIARRLPNTNNSQDPDRIQSAANLFLSQYGAETEEQTTPEEIIQEFDSAYIITDYEISMPIGKFSAVVTWAERKTSEFFDIFAVSIEGQYIGLIFYYPEYYRSLIVRLYNFDGEAVTDVSPLVVNYEDKIDRTGTRYKEVIEVTEFSSYEEAQNYVDSQDSGNYAIVSPSPFISPIPMKATDYRLIYSSEQTTTHQDLLVTPQMNIYVVEAPEVKIFEYAGGEGK